MKLKNSRRRFAFYLASLLLLVGVVAKAQMAVTPQPWSQIGGTVSLAVTVASANVQMGYVGQPGVPPVPPVTNVCNGGSADAYVQLGTSNSVTAAVATGIRVPASQCGAIPTGVNTYLAAITNSGSTTLYISNGSGTPIAAQSTGVPVTMVQRLGVTPFDFQAPGYSFQPRLGVSNGAPGCLISTVSGSNLLDIQPGSAPGCNFVTSGTQPGWYLIVNNAGVSATTPLATTITAINSPTEVVMAANAGQTITNLATTITWGPDATQAVDNCLNNVYGYTCDIGGGFFGVASNAIINQNNNTNKLRCSGWYRSGILALAPMTQLLFEQGGSANYSPTASVQDCGFEGSKVATYSAYLGCPQRFFSTRNAYLDAAPGGINLQIGDGTTTGCTEAKFAGDIVLNRANDYVGTDLPNQLIELNTSDSRFTNISGANAKNIAFQADTHSGDTLVQGMHLWGISSAYYPATAYSLLAGGEYDRLVVDGVGSTGIAIGASNVTVKGGFLSNPSSPSTTKGITIAAGLQRVLIDDFNPQGNLTVPGNIVSNLATDASICYRKIPGVPDYCPLGAPSILCQGVGTNVTGTTAETALATCAVPANALGANGRLQIVTYWTYTSNADTKTMRVRFGGISGTAFFVQAISTSGQQGARCVANLWNNNATGSQISVAQGCSDAPSLTVGTTTAALDTTAAQNLVITGTLGTSTDNIQLVAYTVQLFPHT